MNKLISIIIPVYNVEKYIDRCIESVLNQTYKNIEVILVDDGSPDTCGAICDKYAEENENIKVIHKNNEGLSSARNAGMKLANGEYIGFVDSDDWIEPNMYQYLYELIEKYDADISTGAVVRAYNNKVVEKKKIVEKIKIYSQEEYMRKFFKINSQECVYYAWNKLYKKSIIDKISYPQGLTSEDVLGTYLALMNSNKIVESNVVIYNYFFNEEGITGKFSDKDFDLIEIWDKVVKISENFNSTYFEYAKFNRARIDFTLLTRLVIRNREDKKTKNYDEIEEYLLSSLKKNKKLLLNGEIPLSRKILILLYCNNYELVKKVCNLLK